MSLRHRRRGGATLELAVVLSLVLLIFFGTVDALGMMFVKQSMSLAAYEASRLAASDNATSQEASAGGGTHRHAANLLQLIAVLRQMADYAPTVTVPGE